MVNFSKTRFLKNNNKIILSEKASHVHVKTAHGHNTSIMKTLVLSFYKYT